MKKERLLIKKPVWLVVFTIFSFALQAQDSTVFSYQKGKLVFEEKFEKDLKHWIVESPAELNPKIAATNGKLNIEVNGGATVWLNKKLSGNYVIECKRKVIMDGGDRDRLSDLNVFWAATDPGSNKLFNQTGVLEEYDSLSLYYVGMGGNSNRTTRFRKYQGNGQRTLLREYLDKEHLLQQNHEYFLQIVVYNGSTSLYVDGKLFFSFTDNQPLKEGYFGIRTTKSHHQVDDVMIYELK